MAKYRIDRLAELARQMQFTPQDTRLAQLNAAEELLHTIDPNKAYPVEFVVFRITGYHPKGLSAELLAGPALQHDLGLLIEKVSETLDVQTANLSEPVLSIDDVTERFNVTSKTIQRWRRKGLPARRFVFPDGKRRVGFLIGSVERFFNDHREQVARGTNFSQVSELERQEILRRAQRLSGECGCCEQEVARRIARKLNRSPLTILHIVRKHDQENPAASIFARAGQAISEAQRQRILQGFERGIGLRELARRHCRPRTAIYRLIIESRLERLNQRKIKFIDDPLYHQTDATSVIGEIVAQQELAASPRPEESRIPRDLPPYLQELYRTPLLTPARERAWFLKFNFHKYQFVAARRRLEPQDARLRDLDELDGHLHSAIETKNAILRANLRLVVSIARKHLRPGLSLMELISDGNITLMRAVEGFDIHRGHRFSTYATLALMKGFARSVPQMMSDRRALPVDEQVLDSMQDRRGVKAPDQVADREQIGILLSRLDDRERSVVSAHFGLGKEPVTDEQLGKKLGLSLHRIRQIEKRAVAKLRRAAVSN
ncbi:MAG TPA: sigma-70 family RNA polymerase sigma factor [Tepidisphaeraceae bacterium]|nr:sigma-70 family RNA polymerase sigma factor [Tepidisphaeraceae bacterium]